MYSISRILSYHAEALLRRRINVIMIIISLGLTLPPISSERTFYHAPERCGALLLRSSKDLAVSPLNLLPSLRIKQSFLISQKFKVCFLFPFEKRRLCSHLGPYGRRELPATNFLSFHQGNVRTFLPNLHQGDYRYTPAL